MDQSFANLELERLEDGLLRMSVNRPKVLNALDDSTVREIDSCFAGLRDDPEIRAVIVTGAGEKAFVAGADIRELADQDPAGARLRARVGQWAFDRIEHLGKPVLAAVNGFALGGGAELALACHLRFASPNARFGLPEVSLGLIPGYGGTQRLQRIIGRGRALQWILTGEMMDAEEAHRSGLVNGILPQEELMSGVEAVARTILSRGPVAVRLALEAVLRGGEMALPQGLELEADLFSLVSTTSDMREGTQAFLEKRPAAFRGV